jgi:hypothetical protein
LECGKQRGQLLDSGMKFVDVVLHVQDAANALQVDALILGESLDQPEPGNIASGVASATFRSTPRRNQAHPVIGSQRLRVHPSKVSCDRNDEHRRIVINSLRQL